MSILKKLFPSKDGGKNRAIRVFDFFITLTLAGIFFLLPIFLTSLTAQGLPFDKMFLFYFLVMVSATLWVTKGVVEGEMSVKRTPLDIPIVIFVVVSIAATIFSVNWRDSFFGAYGSPFKSLVSILSLVIFYYVLINNINIKRIKIFFLSAFFSALLVLAYSFCQIIGFFIIPLNFTKNTAFNTIGSLTALAGYIAFFLPIFALSIGLARDIFPKANKFLVFLFRVLSLAGVVGSVIVLFLLNGFTYWPAIIASLAALLVFMVAKTVESSRAGLAVPIFLFFVSIIIIVMGNLNFFNLNLPTEVRISHGISTKIAWNTLKAKPFLGTGVGTFYYSFSKYLPAEFNSSPLWNNRFSSASGSIFEVAATMGALGLLALLVLVLIALPVYAVSIMKTKEKDVRPIILSGFASVVFGLIFSIFFSAGDSIALIMVVYAIFFIASALFISPDEGKSLKLSLKVAPKYSLAFSVIFIAVAAGAAALIAVGAKICIADFYAMRAVYATTLEDQTKYYFRAISFNPRQDIYYLGLANDYLALLKQEASQANPNQANMANYLSSALEAAKTGVALNPNKADNQEALALIYENASFYANGALNQSEEIYNKLSNLEPVSPTPYLRLGLIDVSYADLAKDETDKTTFLNKALVEYDKALQKKNNLSDAYYGKALVYERMNKMDEAIAQAQQAVNFSPTVADYSFELGRLYFNRGTKGANITNQKTEPGPDGELSVEGEVAAPSIQKNNDLVEAEKLFNAVLAANPANVNALYSSALIYQKTGDSAKARDAVQKLLEIITDEQTITAVKNQFPGLY